MNAIERLDIRRDKLFKKQRELEQARVAVIQAEITSIFDKLGIKSKVPLQHMNHFSNNVMVTQIGTEYEVSTTVGKIELILRVKSHEDEQLDTFKKLMS